MNNRQARKMLICRWSKRLERKLNKLYPVYYNKRGNWCKPSVHEYYRIKKAWSIVTRKGNKYRDKFKKL